MNTLFWDSISSFFVCAGIIIALAISFSLYRHRQPMRIMNAVWILTGLWAHYFALFAYYAFGIRWDNLLEKSSGNQSMNMGFRSGMMMDMPMDMDMDEERPQWQSIALSTLHCGAGCALADLMREWFTFFVPIQIGGSLIAGNWVLDFVLAMIFGVFFQFFAIREMESVPFRKALKRAFKADFLSLAAWQIGMYGWMAIVIFVIFKEDPLQKNTWLFWFMMQIAMLWGFFCAYPVNALLIRWGIKKGM